MSDASNAEISTKSYIHINKQNAKKNKSVQSIDIFLSINIRTTYEDFRLGFRNVFI